MDNKRRIAGITMIVLCMIIWIFPYCIESDHDFFMFIEQPIAILLPTIMITKIYLSKIKSSLRQWYPLKKIDFKAIFFLTIIAIALIPIVNYVSELFDFMVSEYTEETFLFVPGEKEGIGYAILTFVYGTLFLSVFPGICEEILFRGALLKLMEDAKLKIPVIVILNGILFGIFHGNMEQLFYTTVMGIVLTIVVIITGSLYTSIYVHMLYNFIVSLADIIELNRIASLQRMLSTLEETNTLSMAVFSSLVIVSMMFLLKKNKVWRR